MEPAERERDVLCESDHKLVLQREPPSPESNLGAVLWIEGGTTSLDVDFGCMS